MPLLFRPCPSSAPVAADDVKMVGVITKIKMARMAPSRRHLKDKQVRRQRDHQHQ